MFIQLVRIPLVGFILGVCLSGAAHAQEAAPNVAASVVAPGAAPIPAPIAPAASTAPAAFTPPAESVQKLAVTPEVENLKVSVLNLNRDLLILEEELLYPPSNQVAIYVSMDIGQFFDLDAVKLEIDNKLVASELYTDKQINALFRGGVQRLYIGNLKTGVHEISAFFTGRGPQQNYQRGAKLMINKAQTPLVLELKIMDSSVQLQPTFEIKEWKAE
jgi:hypothetical protein